LKRLKKTVFNPKVEQEVDHALKVVDEYKFSMSYAIIKKESKVILGRALEIKECYQGTHDIFTHAHATEWFVVSCLIRELFRVFNPNEDIKYFYFLRVPRPEQKDEISIEEYKELLSIASRTSEINDHSELGDHLLSADGYLFNTPTVSHR